MKCGDIIDIIEELAPTSYAMDWDNVGLLIGRRDREVSKLYLALDVTDEVIDAAIGGGFQMIVTHHPVIFGKSGVCRINDDDFKGRWILKLIEAGISVYAMHTNYDIAPGCMAEQCAKRLGQVAEAPVEMTGSLQCEDGSVAYGIGTIGEMSEPMTVGGLAEKVKKEFGLPFVVVYSDDLDAPVTKVALSPGSAKGMYPFALEQGCNVLIGGDLGHHDGIDAVAAGVSLINAGHYGLEHTFMGHMKGYLGEKLGGQVEIVSAPIEVPEKLI